MSETATTERRMIAAGIDADRLRLWMTSGAQMAILDVRDVSLFQAGHLPGAVHAPVANSRELVSKVHADGMTVVVCEDGVVSRQVAGVLQYCGLPRVGYLKEGMASWNQMEERVETPVITPQELRHRLEAGVAHPLLLDVRPVREHRSVRLPGSVQVAAEDVARVAAGRDVILISCTGRRAMESHAALAKVGVKAVVLEGGLDAWILSGGGVERGGLFSRFLWLAAGVAAVGVVMLATR